MKKLFLIFAFILTSLAQADLEVVPYVDLNKFAGTWHEIARYPFSQQTGCHNTTATYTQNEDGTLGVSNRCRKGSFEGAFSVANGKARVVDTASNAKLEVKFFFLAPWADYWIIDLGRDYDFAVISQPSRKYLWILSRTPEMDEALYSEITRSLESNGFDIQKLIRTPQQWGHL